MPTFMGKHPLIFYRELYKIDKFPNNGVSGYINQCLLYFYWDFYSEHMVLFIVNASLINKIGN